jgi:hypothetical protein
MRHRHLGVAALSAIVIGAPWAAAAQQGVRGTVVAQRAPASAPQPGPQQPITVYENQPSYQTQNELQELLNRYPPTVRQVLQLDPTLLDTPDYLATYPALAAMVQRHPEIRRNPTFFFGRPERREDRDPRAQAFNTLENVLAGSALFTGIMVALTLIASLLRQVIEYRRWMRQSRIQTEVNTKILDRLTSNEDLLAYTQTPAGMSYLQAAPMAIAGAPRFVGGVPIGRILWSVQAGVVLAALGIGVWLARGSVMEEIAPAFVVMGTVAVSVGIGFVISATIAWVLTSRLDTVAPKS